MQIIGLPSFRSIEPVLPSHYGAPLAKKNIQLAWVEIRNDSADAYWFLPSGMDPEYFSPSEAAFAFYKDD